MKLLLLGACIDPDEETAGKIVRVAGDVVDWEGVYDYAVCQRLLPIVYKNMQGLDEGIVPGGIKQKFRDAYFTNATRNVRLLHRLLGLVDLLAAEGIDVVPFKGPVQAEVVYGNIELRPFSDLDILIDKKDAVKAWRLFCEKGLRPALDLNDGQKRKYIETEDHMAFSDQAGCVELHWEMTGMYLGRPVGLAQVRDDWVIVRVGNREIRSLSLEKMLLYLCIHGSKDIWENLEQVLSIAELIRNTAGLDWEKIGQLADAWGCRRVLLTGLCLAGDIFDAPLPGDVALKVAGDKTAGRLAGRVREKLLREDYRQAGGGMPGRFSFYHLKVRDTWGERLRYLFRLVFVPTEKEWRFFPVPGYLGFMLYVLRPVRLVWSEMRGGQ